MELEQDSVCQKNLRYIEELQAKDKEEREKQLKMDQETAHALQKEEMEHLGDFLYFIECLFVSFFPFVLCFIASIKQMNVFRNNNNDTY